MEQDTASWVRLESWCVLPLPAHRVELRVPRGRKGSKTGVVTAGGQALRHQSIIYLRTKLLEPILREGTGRDQRLPCSEIREQVRSHRREGSSSEDGETLEKALTLEEAREREMGTIDGEAVSSQD